MVLTAPFYDHDGQIAIDLPGARAVFTTRVVGRRSRDPRQRSASGSESSSLCQAGARQHEWSRQPSRSVGTGCMTEADALIATVRGLAPMVLAADCLPIVIAGPGSGRGGARRLARAGQRRDRNAVAGAPGTTRRRAS